MRFTTVILAAVVASPACAQDSRLDLPAALQTAEADNLELRAARQQRAMAVAGLISARQIPNPTIGIAVSRDAPHEAALWDQPIEVGGQRGKRIALAKEEQKATEVDISALSRQVRRRTREAFYRVLAARAQADQAKAALELATRVRDVARQRFDAGDVAQLDVNQAQVELERASADHEASVQAQKSADVQLSALLSRPLEEHWDLLGRLETVPTAAALPALNNEALRFNAEVQRTTQEVEVEQRRLAVVKSQRVPNLDLQLGADLNAPRDYDVGPRAQLGITLPLFYHGQGEVALSSARLAFLQLTLSAQKTNASAQLAAAYYDYVAKAHLADRYGQEIVPQTTQLQAMAEDSYRSGKSNLLTLIDAERRLNETRRAYLEALLGAHDSFAALEEVVGTSLD